MIWVNCKELKPVSPYQFYTTVLPIYGITPTPGDSSSILRDRFYAAKQGDGKPLILVVDEVDDLTGTADTRNVLYDLLQSDVTLLLMSNVFDWVERSGDSRLQSRAQLGNRLVFVNCSREFNTIDTISKKALSD